MIRSFAIRTGFIALAFVAVQAQAAAAQSEVDQARYERAYNNMVEAKAKLDGATSFGGTRQEIDEKKEAYDKAVENYENEIDDYVSRHGDLDDYERVLDLRKALNDAEKAYRDAETKPGATPEQIRRARTLRDRAIRAAKERFREKTYESRQKAHEYLERGLALPGTLDRSVPVPRPPTRTSSVAPGSGGTRTATGTPGAGTALATGTPAFGTLGSTGGGMMWGGGVAMTPVSYVPDMPAMTVAWDSILLCTFHPTIPYWFPFTPAGPSIAEGNPVTPGSTPGSTPGGSTPGSTPGGSTPDKDKPGFDWTGLRYTPGLGGLGSKLGDDYGDWGKIAYLPQDKPRSTTRKEPQTQQPTTPPPIYINFKATLAAMRAGQSGAKLPGEQFKLFPDSTVDPALPGTNTAKNDVGHDGEPMQGTTSGPDNSVTIPFNWSLGAGLKYKLDRFDLGGTYNYEVKVDPTRTSVIGSGDKGRIGNRAFDGFGIDMVDYRTFWGSQDEAEQLTKTSPEDFQINWCRAKEPLAPGTDANITFNPKDALPGAMLDLETLTAQGSL